MFASAEREREKESEREKTRVREREGGFGWRVFALTTLFACVMVAETGNGISRFTKI